MWEIPVFKAEKEAGIAELVRATASVMCSCDVEIDPNPPEKTESYLEKLAKAVAAANPNQFDLYYLKTLLVSTGWNKNYDFFTKAEVWTARHTPEDKPINYEHDMSDIIGHITSNYVIDDDKNIIKDGLTIDELPDTFHIVTAGVLYSHWEDQTLQDRMQRIIAEIKENKWYVSMEALFKGFDYAVVGKDEKFHIVARTEESAFLTKHLKAYGGSGQYDGYKLGRVMRNMVFSGKGLVRKPANDKSIIFNSEKDLLNIKANKLSISEDLVYKNVASTNRENLMSAETKVYEDKIKDLEGELAKAKDVANQTISKSYASEIESLKTQLAEGTKKIDSLKADLAKANDENINLKKELDTNKTQLEEANELIQETQASVQQSERTSFVMDKLEITDKAKATAFVEKWSNLDDEAFKALAAEMGDYKTAKINEYKSAETAKSDTLASDPATKSGTVPTVPSAKVTVKKPVKTVPNAGGAPVSVKKNVVNMGAANEIEELDSAEPEQELALSTAADVPDDEVEAVRASINERYEKMYESRKTGRKAKR